MDTPIGCGRYRDIVFIIVIISSQCIRLRSSSRRFDNLIFLTLFNSIRIDWTSMAFQLHRSISRDRASNAKISSSFPITKVKTSDIRTLQELSIKWHINVFSITLSVYVFVIASKNVYNATTMAELLPRPCWLVSWIRLRFESQERVLLTILIPFNQHVFRTHFLRRDVAICLLGCQPRKRWKRIWLHRFFLLLIPAEIT